MINSSDIRRYNDEIILSLSSLLIITLPVSLKLNSLSIIFFITYWLISGSFLNYKTLFNKYVVIQIVFYLFFVIGYFFSEDKKNAAFQIEQKLPLLIFPVIISTMPKLNTKMLQFILSIFVYTCLFYSLYCLLSVTLYSINNDYSFAIENFVNQNLVSYINFHSTYFSLYLLFSISILITHFNNKTFHFSKHKLITGVLILFFSFVLILLGARMILASGLILFLFFAFKTIKKNKLFVMIGSLLLIFVFTYLLTTKNFFQERISEVFSFKMNSLIGTNNENGVSQRLFFWINSVEIIKEKPIIGHGSGDVNFAFSHQYNKLLIENTFSDSERSAILFFKNNNYNAHNQYLQICIAFGIVGISYFLFQYFLFFKVAVNNPLYSCFLLLFLLAMLTECTYERQQGIVFFMFFNNLFLFCYKNMKAPNISKR